MSRPRLVIVGANFAGLKAAQSLDRRYHVTVVDQSSWFEWLPNIHELVSGVKRAGDLRLPRRRLVTAAGHHFVRARVEAIDAQAGKLVLENGRELRFEVCIVAVGGVHDTFGVPGADRFAAPFKTVAHSGAIGRDLQTLSRGREPMSVAIVGGGLEGIEVLGEILRRYRARPGFTVAVIEAADRLLPGAPAGLDKILRAHCEGLGVRLAVRSHVAEVRKRQIVLDSGATLPYDLCIWSGGSRPAALLHDAGLSRRARDWAPAHATLQSRARDNVLVAGDAAALPERLSKQAFYALQMGEHAAANADRLVRGRPLLEFAPSNKPMIVTFGDLDTFFVQDGTAIAGTGLAAVKEAVYQLTMAQLDPPTSGSSLAGFGKRLSQGLASVLPAVTSPERLLRLPQVRLV